MIVYEADDKQVTQQQHHQRVALKRCIPNHESSDGFPITTLREIQSLKVWCQQANIVHLLEITVNDNATNPLPATEMPKL
jgi:hypothetical protein